MSELQNPFEKHGYQAWLMDVATQALKRGRNGVIEPVSVELQGNRGVIQLSPGERDVISYIVDNAVGVESVRTVGFAILALVGHKFDQ